MAVMNTIVVGVATTSTTATEQTTMATAASTSMTEGDFDINISSSHNSNNNNKGNNSRNTGSNRRYSLDNYISKSKNNSNCNCINDKMTRIVTLASATRTTFVMMTRLCRCSNGAVASISAVTASLKLTKIE